MDMTYCNGYTLLSFLMNCFNYLNKFINFNDLPFKVECLSKQSFIYPIKISIAFNNLNCELTNPPDPDWLMIVGLLHPHPIRWVGVTSVCWCLFVLRTFHGEEIFKFPLECLKCRPLHCILVPTFKHYFIKGCWTTWWTWHSVTVFNLVQHFCICHSWK